MAATRMVPLGFGTYVRADRVYALEPIVGDERSERRRTRVWVEGISDPLIASRTQRTILADMGEEAAASQPTTTEAFARVLVICSHPDTSRSPGGEQTPGPRVPAASTAREDPSMLDRSQVLARGERAVVTALGRAPAPVQRLLAGRPAVADGVPIEPEVGAALRLLNAMPGTRFEDLPVDRARAQLDHEAAVFGGPPLPMQQVLDLTIPSPAGDLPARLYRAAERDADRLVVYFHGGGWVVGSLASADSACRFLARHAGVSVLSVAYRLAPEHPFPAAPDDTMTAFRFAVAQASEWGHDPHLIAVAGDSAGANLAAVLCQDLRARDEVQPGFQLLFFPVTDLSTKHPSYREFADGFFLTARQMDWYRGHYLAGHDSADPRVSPLLGPDLSGLPPAYVAVSGFDPLRDEGEAYARAMAAAGVRVGLRRHDGLIHAFVNGTGVGHTSRAAFLEACGALRAGIGAGTAPR